MKALLFLSLLSIGLISCNNSNSAPSRTTHIKQEELVKPPQDSIIYSFVFTGCNRVDRGDQQNTAATNASSANVYVLKRIFEEVSAMERKPELFFFLGDLVYAESTLDLLNSQLKAWVQQYKDQNFSPISTSGIELVAVPGNHEMLSWADHNVSGHDEWPLKGATQVWMQYMAPYMPKDRVSITGQDSEVNQMTFSFTRENVAFVVMNTDTYNPPTAQNPWGLEGQIPTQWIISQVEKYKKDASIDHVFVLGHKPYYVSGTTQTGHEGLPEGPVLWPALNQANVVAMLSAHYHDYQRMQPGDKGTYQIIAGNGGSSGPAAFFGYTIINIMSSGKVELKAKGFKKGEPYYQAVPENPSLVQDSTLLTSTKNPNPYKNF